MNLLSNAAATLRAKGHRGVVAVMATACGCLVALGLTVSGGDASRAPLPQGAEAYQGYARHIAALHADVEALKRRLERLEPDPLQGQSSGELALRGSDGAMVVPGKGHLVHMRRLSDGADDTEQRHLRAMAERGYQSAARILEALARDAREHEALPMPSGGPLVAFAPLPLHPGEPPLDHALAALDAARQAARRMPLANPLPGSPVTSRFGMRRDPIVGVRALHTGIDFRARPGARVHATGSGTVTFAGWNGGYGRMVEIDHGDGLTSRYAHLQTITVKAGEPLAAGRVIGTAGTTGRSTGPHLHYEVRKAGQPVDPERYLETGALIAGLL